MITAGEKGNEHVKIAFELEQDEDGYPPDKYETIWAMPLVEQGLYGLDNIPIYAKGVSSEDVVRASTDAGRLMFESLERSSGNSVVRVFVTDESAVQSTRQRFRELGCESELSYVPRLFAMEIPATHPAEVILRTLEDGVIAKKWEYEIGVLRHHDPTEINEVAS